LTQKIQSPLPGTFYRRPAPDQPNFIEDGASVSVGDTVGLVEVMKTFHEVKAEADGENLRFLIGNDEPIMAGAVLAEMD
jgi:acetyl-CoA carboxylase biotin carboxyl carrier protein